MVLMTGSKSARQQSSIVNRPTCGGNKKSGLPIYTGLNANISLQEFGVSGQSRPGVPCTAPIFTARRNQLTAGGVGKKVLLIH